MKSALACLLAALLAAPAYACEGLVAAGGWVRMPPPGSTQAAAYFELANTSQATISVTAVASPDFDMAMLHESRHVDGSVEMRHLDQIELAPGARFRAAPGGAHVMLAQAHAALAEGQPVRLRLSCAGGSTLAFDLPVRRHAPE